VAAQRQENMQPFDDEVDTLELRDYLAVLRRRKLTVVLTTLAVMATALAVSFVQTPVYAAETTLLLRPRTSEQIFAPESEPQLRVTDRARAIDTEIGVMESRSIREAVTAELGHEPEVTIRSDGQTDLVTITAESTDPAQAAREADTYARVYLETRRQQLVADLQTAIDQVQAKIVEIETAAEQPLADLDARIAAASPGPERRALEEERAELAEQVEALQGNVEAQQAPYVTQLNELQVAVNLTQTGGAQVVSRAEVPESPARPVPLRNGAVAAVLGLVLGVGLAFLREYLDETITTKDDLQQAAGGRNVLGLIPAVPGWKDRAKPRLVSITDPGSPAAEAYRTLRTSVQFIGLERPVKLVQFTSPSSGEGKTTTLANLAVALAGAGQRVIVVCCDLRRPRLHEFFGLPDDPGFTSVLLGQVPLASALQGVPGQTRLALLASGPQPPNPSELLASPRAEELLALLKSEADVVLIDSPPVLPVTDGLVLARMVDATILVATANLTTRKEVHRTVELLDQVDAPLVGAVLNAAEPESVYGYGSRYGNSYAPRPDAGGNGRGADALPPVAARPNGTKRRSATPGPRGRPGLEQKPWEGDDPWRARAGDA
jgi:succinoglycan biosynthesis transport protein ExoP